MPAGRDSVNRQSEVRQHIAQKIGIRNPSLTPGIISILFFGSKILILGENLSIHYICSLEL